MYDAGGEKHLRASRARTLCIEASVPGEGNNAGDCSIFLHGFVRLLATAVLRIHDILVWIRIRGSMPLTNGSGSGSGFGMGSCYFRH
jgi:hypothetical protein